MSIAVSAAVWKHSRSKGSARLVLLAIADFAHDDGNGAYPSVATLAEWANVSERAAQYAIRDLVALGELAVEPGGGRGNTTVYRVLVKGAESAPFKEERVQSTTLKGAKSVVKGADSAPEPLGPVREPYSPPTPPKGGTPTNGGVRVSYALVLNGKLPGVSAAFRKLSPELTDGWLQASLAAASQECRRPLSENEVLAKLGVARAAIKRQLSVERQDLTAWRPNNLPAWARSRVVNALKE